MSASLTTTLIWEGRTIRLSYKPCMWGVIDHLEIRVDDQRPIPITETGYRSHFFGPAEPPLTENDLVTLVRGWLEEAARDPSWIEAEEKRSQLSLF